MTADKTDSSFHNHDSPAPQINVPEILFTLSEGNLLWQYREGSVQSQAISVAFESNLRDTEQILMDLIRTMTPIFYLGLPKPNLEIVCTPELAEHPKFSGTLQILIETIRHTNAFLTEIENLRNIASTHENTLFYEFEQNDFHQLYELALEFDASTVRYARGELGFNKITREWEKDHEQTLGLRELIEKIKVDRIKKLVIVNMYYPQIILRERVHLSSVLRFLGVELMMVDFDLYDHGYQTKAAFHCNEFRRYSCYEHHQRVWDEILGLKNVRYLPTGYVRNPFATIAPLSEDYGIAIASHARARDLCHTLDALTFIFESIEDAQLIDGFQLWYYSFKHWIMSRSDLQIVEKAHIYRILYILYLSGITFLKYEMIASLKTDRPIVLFGDQEWSELFPQYYQGKYLENYEEFFRQRKHINLLINSNLSYLENNPVFARALRLGTPFLCFEPLLKSERFSGMKSVEYGSGSELNLKIESINESIQRSDFLNSKADIEKLLWDGFKNIALDITQPPSAQPKSSLFDAQSQVEFQNATRRYETEILAKSTTFQNMFEILFQGKAIDFKLENSKFRDRDYYQRLLRMKSK